MNASDAWIGRILIWKPVCAGGAGLMGQWESCDVGEASMGTGSGVRAPGGGGGGTYLAESSNLGTQLLFLRFHSLQVRSQRHHHLRTRPGRTQTSVLPEGTQTEPSSPENTAREDTDVSTAGGDTDWTIVT